MDDQEEIGAEGEVKRIVLSEEQTLSVLCQGAMEVQGLLPYSSNYTFLATLTTADEGGEEFQALVVYKPRKGERPLWDFQRGTLCKREVGAYLVSQALGWGLVPPTVLRSGPHGLGMVQLYVDHDPEEHYFTFHDEIDTVLPRIVLFDAIINNADRKGGHCLRDPDGRIWCIDHGITFHTAPKLRTVIWELAGEEIPEPLVEDLRLLQEELARDAPLHERLNELLSPDEMEALANRVSHLIHSRRFPEPGPGRHVPWPMV